MNIAHRYDVPTLNRRTFMGLSAAALAFAGPVARAEEPPSRYTYKDTQNLVSMVEEAARLIETEGEAAFAEFGVKGSRWFDGHSYIFVYADDGTVAFHPISPELVGKKMASLRDIDGKSVVAQIIEIGAMQQKDASGWVFYRWQDQRQLTPVWKSSYVRKAVAPDGKAYLVGSGLYGAKIERAFVEDRVNQACELLLKEGKEKAFATFQEPSSPFIFLDTYVFVLDDKGNTIVDPAFPTLAGRNMNDFTDAVGAKPVQQLIDKLAKADSAWVQFLWPKPGDVMPTRRLIYARKVVMNGETFIIGADLYLATPIWMKVEDSHPWQQNLPG